jgi:dTDP-4-amino-4,6-dideoxygalactose transaminase
MESSFIPFHRPSIGRDEIDAVTRVLESKWLTTGPVTHAFERAFAEYVGCKYALAVNSCTAALQLGLDAIGIGPGDEVLVPAYTFTATAEVVTYFGARPVLCDSIKGGFNIDPADAAQRVTERTRAIIPVHIAGEPCDLAAIRSLADKHGLCVIEDAAHALPAAYQGKRIGSISELTAFSFYATKTITTGEGGMLTTDNDEYARRAAVMRLHGISGDAWKRYSKEGSWFYEVLEAGYKLNLTDLQSALGMAQLKKADQFAAARAELAQFYFERFSGIEELELPPSASSGSEHSWHLFILRIRPEFCDLNRAILIDRLKRAGIGTSVHFIPLHLQPYYQQAFAYAPGDFPQAEDAYQRCFSLPIYPDLTKQEAKRIADAVEQVVLQSQQRILMAAS